MSLRTDCQEYITLLNSPANGWGQHVHPVHGQSHNMLRWLYDRHGEQRVVDELDRQFGAAERLIIEKELGL